MARPCRTIAPLAAEATTTRTEAETPAPLIPSPVEAIELEQASEVPQRSPARQNLADQIERLKQTEAEIREAGAATELAESTVFAAQRALDAAEDVLRNARPRDDYAPALSSYSYWGSNAENEEKARRARAAAAAPPISIADAKAAVEVAKDALDTARRTRQHYEDRHKRACQNLTLRQFYLRDAVRDVLRSEPATLALAQRCRRLKTQSAAARDAFNQVITGDTIQIGSPFYGWDSASDARTSPEAMSDWAVSREWREALDALKTDPDAPLPMSPAA